MAVINKWEEDKNNELNENVICYQVPNPQKPLEEYILVMPEEYKPELTFEDYKKFKKVHHSQNA